MRVGEEAMQKVHSPSPNTEYSANWPVRKEKAFPSPSSAKARRSVRTSGVSSVTCSIRMR
jgi:hypothetical protein